MVLELLDAVGSALVQNWHRIQRQVFVSSRDSSQPNASGSTGKKVETGRAEVFF